MNNKPLSVLIGITVAIICVAALMMPAIDASKEKEEVTQADGSFRYYATDAIGVGTYTVDSGTLKLNDEAIGTEPANIISDKFRIIFYNGGLTLYDYTTGLNSVSLKSINFSEDGTYTYTNTSDVETTATSKINWFMGVAPTGNYVFGIGTYSLNVNENSPIYITTTSILSDGTSSYDAGKYIFNAKGTVKDLTAICQVWSGGAWVEKSAQATLTDPADVSEGVLQISADTTPILTVDDHENTTGMLVFAPYKYYVISDGVFNSLLGVIPVLVIVAILLGAVGMIYNRRD